VQRLLDRARAEWLRLNAAMETLRGEQA
jgi:hypothetical protein